VYPSRMDGPRRTRSLRRGVALLAAFAVLAAAAALLPPPAAAAPWSGRTYPKTYDLRAHGRVTRVGLQDHHSTCWIFAATGSLESCLLPGARLDLSENHMADFQGSRLRFEGRAPSTISTAYVARWEGPVLEREDPYPHPGASREGLRAVRHVQEVLFLPPHSSPRANAAIKWAVMKYGAVDATMAYEHRDFNAATSAYYSRGSDLDHHVCIVGWNDAYPARRFLRRPPGPGAFLIKNSWGTKYGRGGYFWISYYDRSLGTTLTVFDGVEGAANHDAIYQHDALGWSKSIGYQSTTAWFAARYTSGGDGSVTAVSLYTEKPGAIYEVRVAPALAAVPAAPVAGSGTLAVGGYHTVDLATPVAVTDGADFVVAVRLTTPGSRAPIPVEHPTKLLAPRAAVARSFISRDGETWQDLRTKPGFATSDVCLKAFVDSAGARDSAAPRVRLEPATARRGAGTRIRFTLTDPAFSSGSAVVKLWLRDASGRVLRRLRVPAVTVNERDTWRFAAPAGRGVYRIVARAWDVAGHRSALTRADLRVR
jgi:C1A family cysteine protease